jgi:hypothetical protein
VKILNNLCEYTLTLEYENNSAEAIDCEFIFPLDYGMSVSKLTASFGEKKVESIILELE